MKTQLFTLAIGFIFCLSLSANASEETKSGTNEDLIPVETLLSATEFTSPDEELTLENWMTSDDLWETADSTPVNIDVTEDEEIQLEDWMTDPAVWNKNFKTTTVFEKNGKAYMIIHSFKFKKSYDEPLTVQRWMINDNIWRM